MSGFTDRRVDVWVSGTYAAPHFTAELPKTEYPDQPELWGIFGTGPTRAHAIADLEAQLEAL